jgi:hypothetical protein
MTRLCLFLVSGSIDGDIVDVPLSKLALTIRFLWFCLFFGVGAGAMTLAILAEPELLNYYLSRRALDEVYAQNEKIKELTDQYTAQIQLIEQEPNVLDRIRVLAFNQPPQKEDTVFPRGDDQRLRQKTQDLFKMLEAKQHPPRPLPAWLERCIQPKIRRALFLAGAALAMLTFIFFGSPRRVC